VQAYKTIHHPGSDLPQCEMTSSLPKPKVLGDSEILLDGAAQIPRALQIAGKLPKDYAQMIGRHPPPDIGTEQTDSFHASLGTKGFSRPRHDSSTPIEKKEKP